ncbi:DNA-processing protein DprA [uncultured Lamprocystis sp.]|jgi:predicted Rossmann fold nucleotide-binding protein DprA/Smf involved in DNA uptake|uniref:DNA-processing protein DprA n=1 Tax=uncultured Lamprocystis sp. TaxID=543132 RepID=UPI0025CC9CF6|nr:DNA-processing protein DprA [uncultured Lamprocystis sp.]
MNDALSPNTQAILLLTAPLIIGRGKTAADLLTPGQYKRVAQSLREQERQPSDLLGPNAATLCAALGEACAPQIDCERLRTLLDRGFQLSQALERWHARAIWVVSRADAAYPRRLKSRLRDDAPAILYGCGNSLRLETGGLAVVGSRHVDQALIEYTEGVGRLAAKARRTLVSGAARGIDQAAMRGALQAEGQAIGVLADSLESTALNREHRNLLLEERLVLISPYDPSAGFNVGNAMQRNKLIYALADAALVVSSDYKKGGTWAGASEQLQKYRLVPVYVRATGEMSQGLQALLQAGALPWPEPKLAEDLIEVLSADAEWVRPSRDPGVVAPGAPNLPLQATNTSTELGAVSPSDGVKVSGTRLTPAEELFATVRSLIERMPEPKTEAEIADELNVPAAQAKKWLARLMEEGVVEKMVRPVRYRAAADRPVQGSLFR